SWTSIPPQLNGATSGTVLTRHGVTLDRVDILSVADGGAILRVQPHDDAPRYHKGMSDLELVELVTASLTRMGFTDVATVNARPQRFAGGAGVRFGLTGRYHSGLNMRGDVILVQAHDKLDAIMFIAPAAYYYDANAQDIDHLMTSARLAS